MRIQSSVLVHLGFGKYVRSDQVMAVIPIEEDRGPGRRTFIHIQGQTDPIVASRAEDSIVRDLVQEPREVTQSRQQQEILHDLLADLSNINHASSLESDGAVQWYKERTCGNISNRVLLRTLQDTDTLIHLFLFPYISPLDPSSWPFLSSRHIIRERPLVISYDEQIEHWCI